MPPGTIVAPSGTMNVPPATLAPPGTIGTPPGAIFARRERCLRERCLREQRRREWRRRSSGPTRASRRCRAEHSFAGRAFHALGSAADRRAAASRYDSAAGLHAADGSGRAGQYVGSAAERF